jgi:toxin ParE1/3/4
MELIWSARAKRDVKNIGVYIARDNRTAAVAMVKRIVAAAEDLIDHPELGRASRVAGTRELIVAGTRYIVVYRQDRNAIRVAAVMHMSREWPDAF